MRTLFRARHVTIQSCSNGLIRCPTSCLTRLVLACRALHVIDILYFQKMSPYSALLCLAYKNGIM
jgi:hypothetical protein